MHPHILSEISLEVISIIRPLTTSNIFTQFHCLFLQTIILHKYLLNIIRNSLDFQWNLYRFFSRNFSYGNYFRKYFKNSYINSSTYDFGNIVWKYKIFSTKVFIPNLLKNFIFWKFLPKFLRKFSADSYGNFSQDFLKSSFITSFGKFPTTSFGNSFKYCIKNLFLYRFLRTPAKISLEILPITIIRANLRRSMGRGGKALQINEIQKVWTPFFLI